jgi:hypothetical protein
LALALSASSGTLGCQMRLLVIALILPATIVFVIVAFETSYPPPLQAPAQAIVWHGHTFVARDDFARWLRSRGVRYAVWARRHEAFLRSRRRARAQYAAGVRPAQKSFDRSAVRIGGGLAVLAGLGLVGVLLRSRRPGIGGSARQTFRLGARRAAPAARRGTRPTLRWAKATALLSSKTARSSAKLVSLRGAEFAGSLDHRAAPPARRGTRLTLRWAKATAQVSSRTAKSSAKLVSRRGTEFARSFARPAAPAAKRGARLMLSLATAAALLSSSLAASSAKTIRRRRSEFSWYLASALLATGIGLLATVWLNRG